MFASALLLPLFLGLTGFFLDRAFSNSLEVAVHSRLRGHVNLLFSVAELHESRNKIELRLPLTLREADFEQPNSGLYAYVLDSDNNLQWHSNSAALVAPPDFIAFNLDSQPGQMVFSQLNFNDAPFFTAHYDVFWSDSRNRPHPYRFLVMLSAGEYNAELSAYRKELWRWLGAACVFLFLAQLFILRWGLRPLHKLARALQAMQSGDTSSIEGEHPREVQRVVTNLNQVLVREQSLRQRYRNSLADLAHSLKTPLAVLQSKLGPSTPTEELRHIADEQVARMSQVVTYQLQRAVSSQQAGTLRRTRLEPIMQRLLSALHKVYADKNPQSELQLAPNSTVAGDEQDMMELLGNILENAFKYGAGQVRVSSQVQGQWLRVDIEDNGTGVPIDERERILQRGQRLDTNKPGQGIGLSVAAEIVRSYEGKICIDDSDLGGARFSIHLPLLPQA